MAYQSFTLIIAAMAINNSLSAQNLDFSKIKTYEHQLDDVMEIIDTTELVVKLHTVEQQFHHEPTEINKVRLGLIYHETALNLGFLAKSKFKGYAKKSYDILTALHLEPKTTKELLPFVSSYRASALSLVGGETMKLGLVGDAFKLFEKSIQDYGAISYSPAFLRGSVAENLPWFFFSKRKFAKIDMQSIIEKQASNSEYANWKIMSFVYWAWANQNQSKKYRTQALTYLDKAIALDPDFKAGRQRAEQLKAKIMKPIN
jgi:tetratricopeptide (TPR) repeat protein